MRCESFTDKVVNAVRAADARLYSVLDHLAEDLHRLLFGRRHTVVKRAPVRVSSRRET